MHFAVLTLFMASVAVGFAPAAGRYATYTSVPGFFKQDSDSTNATAFDYNDNLGLWDNLTWPEFTESINKLNAHAPLNTSYKVIFFARHAEGYHNVAESYYGTPLWNCYYSLMYGNGTIEWGPDAYLTSKGVQNARNNSQLIKSLLRKGMPLPESFYSSPFTRAADTLVLTWNDIVLKSNRIQPIFKESLRETIGLHTCDMRRNKTYIEHRYPQFQFEANFISQDYLWTKDEQEPDGGKQVRLLQFLNDLFSSDEKTFISVTAHSGVASALLAVLGHRKFSLSTGAIIPLVVKRVASLGFVPPTSTISIEIGTSATAPTCSMTPVSTLVSAIASSTMDALTQPGYA